MKLCLLKHSLTSMLLMAPQVFAQELPPVIVVNPKMSTSAVTDDADDPAIWVHPTDPSKSLIVGTDKGNLPNGGLFVWNMDGTLHQHLNVDHPNNVDVRYGMRLGAGLVDIAAASMSDASEIRIFKIDPDTRMLSDITTAAGIPVVSTPYGICLYKRPADGAMFAFVSDNVNTNNKLWQLLLEDDGTGKVRGTKVREVGNFTGRVEGLVADDGFGYLYAAEEDFGVHKFYADPSRGDMRLALFATGDGITGEREGIAIYKCNDGTGYLLLSSQGDTAVKVYPREGAPGNPHQHNLITTIKTNGAVETDGLEVTSLPTSVDFPYGFLVSHNSIGRNFRLYAWEDIAQTYLKKCLGSIGVGDKPVSVPTEFALEQNYPNPFNASTNIGFQIPHDGQVALTIYNLIGQEIRHFAAMQHAIAGRYSIRWDGLDDEGRSAPTGIYFYRMGFDNHVAIQRMVLLR
jgi:3-phytase